MKKTLFLFIILLGMLLPSAVTAAPGDSFAEAETAIQGINSASLSDSSDSHYFKFTGDGIFEFSLIGPTGTDFDMTIYDSTEFPIDGAYGTTYPDSAIVEITNFVYINVYSFSGSGDFTLEIQPSLPEPELVSVAYSDELSMGDEFTWTIEETYDGTTDTAELTAKVLTDDLTATLDSDYDPFFEVTQTYNGMTDTYEEVEMFPFILITSATFDNGTTVGLRQIIDSIYLDEAFDVSESDGKITYSISYYGESISITWDISSGILEGYTITSGDDEIRVELTSSSIDLDEEEDEEEADLLSQLPFDAWFFALSLIAIPVLRRKFN